MRRRWFVVLFLCSAQMALAQDSDWSVSVGARAWATDWTTFSYYPGVPEQPNLALTQVAAKEELVLMPVASVRYRNFVGSLSGFTSTDFSFDDGTSGERKEFDVNVGYLVMPGLALTLGYKEVSQSGESGEYRPAGPVVGVNGNAPLSGRWSMYGNLGLGWLKTPGGDKIDFDADYRLAEVGLAYTLSGSRQPKHWTFTGGYRIQVMTSKEAIPEVNPAQDGRDTTQGFTLGVIATF